MESTHKDSGLNIFLFLAKLEQNGMKLSDQNKATILAKMNYLESKYNDNIANWKSQVKNIGTLADKAQSKADDSGGFFSTFFGKIIGIICIVLPSIMFPGIGVLGSIGVGVALGMKTNMFKSGGAQSNAGAMGKNQEAVSNAGIAQQKVQKTQQKKSSLENLDLNSQQQNQQSMQNMFNSMIKNFGTMGSYNNRG